MKKAMKKVLAMVMALAVLMTAAMPVFAKSAAQVAAETGAKTIVKGISDSINFKPRKATGYWSKNLSTNGQTAYVLIKEGIEKGEKSIKMPKISAADQKEIQQDLYWENPELFYVKIKGTNTFKTVSAAEGDYCTYTPVYVDNYKQKISQVNSKISSILAGAPKNGSDYDKELYVHDYIIDHVEYQTGKNTIYDSLIEGKGNCMGYSFAMTVLLNKLGVETRVMHGGTTSARDKEHMWNIVKLNGKEYVTDATWDDNGGNRVRYAYFNVPASEISRDHFPDNAKEWANCTSTDQDYYRKNGLYFNSYDELAAKLPTLAKNKEFSFKMKSSDDAKAAYEKIVSTNALNYVGSIGRKGPFNGAITIILK